MTIQDDITHRSADVHWPQGLTPTDADLFAHNEIVIEAPPHQVWKHLIAATEWPQWYSNAANVVVDKRAEVLSEGATFQWTTFGLGISSSVAEFVPHSRRGWYGNARDLRAYHTWLLLPRAHGTYVVMEEIGLGRGRGAKQLAQTNPGHTTFWNVSLKFLCEA